MRVELIRIAERATTLDERLGPSVVCGVEKDDDPLIQFRLNKWKEAATNGDEHLFWKRLQMDGIDPATAQCILGNARFRNREDLPRWVQTLQELVDSAGFVDLSAENHRQTFDEVLFPFVRVAHEKVKTLASANLKLLSPAALETLMQSLLLRLSRTCSRPLALELNVARLLGKLTGDTPKDRYYEFIRTVTTPEGMLAFFSEYSVAGRLVATHVDHWVDSTAEFLSRLQHDLPEITARFAAGQHPGEVVAIQDHLSDPHYGGRTTKQITFSSGLKLLYKPKNLTMDAAFQDLLDWINAQNIFLPLKTFALLNRETHGWVECLNPQPCRGLQEIENYFRRAGLLLCILHALGATDCHSENIFACGEFPVLIDLENLLEIHAIPPLAHYLNADELAQEMSRLSLLHTGMLPRWTFGDAGAEGADFSGLMGGTAQQLPYRSLGWVDSETDHMRLESKYLTVNSNVNRPTMGEKQQDVSAFEYQAQIEQGFQEMYQFLAESKDALPKSAWIARLVASDVRYLNRATAEYSLILQKSLNPEFLKMGIDRSIHLDLLCRNMFLQNKEFLWNLVKPERQALERLDIPYFSASAKGTSLVSDSRDFVADTAFVPTKDHLLKRLASLDVDAMKKQILFLRASISMRSGPKVRGARPDVSAKTDAAPLLKRSDLVLAAARIGENLKNWAIRSSDGSINWVGAEYVPDLNQFSISPLQNTFYSGKVGIALFLAALDRIIPDQGYASMALGALQTVRETFQGEKAQFHARYLGLGAMSGIGSICWSLLRIGQLLHKTELIDSAAQIGSLIHQDLIAKDRHMDIVSGSAGAILSLLALHQSFPAAGFRDRAEECGKHLLNQSIRNGQIRAWQTLRGERLTGFSHGASGYAYALFRLFQATGNEEYRDAALQAFAYERSVFSQKEGNWPDFRIDANGGTIRRFMTGWCHGAPGITLARIACLSNLDSQEIKNEIHIGLETTLCAVRNIQDDICCGQFSRIETLLIASKQLKRPDLQDAAMREASILAHTASRKGSFRLDPENCDGLLNPGFMKGISGIGYTLLRLADQDDSLPSPLLM